MRKIFYAFTLFAALTSCKKDETLRYNNVTMANINGETIVSDQGNTFNVAETPFEVDLSKYKRAMIICDVLKETAENTYDIRLNGIASVLEKGVKTMEDSTEEEDLNTNDAVVLQDIWYSGGYLNMIVEVALKSGSETVHYINLVQEESVDGKYVFSLRHNAKGDVPTEEDRDEYSGAPGYVSFPIAGIIEGDTAKIVLKWKSHKFTGCGFSLVETEDKTDEYDWERNGHEHVPNTVRLKSAAGIL